MTASDHIWCSTVQTPYLKTRRLKVSIYKDTVGNGYCDSCPFIGWLLWQLSLYRMVIVTAVPLSDGYCDSSPFIVWLLWQLSLYRMVIVTAVPLSDGYCDSCPFIGWLLWQLSLYRMVTVTAVPLSDVFKRHKHLDFLMAPQFGIPFDPDDPSVC
jgi:hypothetical protein